jgi:hypothetical protein
VPEPKPPEPAPKPDVKPEPPKPPPPKPDVKPEPPKPPQDASFDAMLKNLAKQTMAADKTEKTATAAPPPAASSQPIAPLGAQLSTSEIDVVREQIERCWNVPVGARDASDLVPEFRILMNRDGTVRDAQLVNSDRDSDPFFQAAAESARRAILNTNCHGPLKLPPDKYDQWQTIDMTFDPKGIS